MSKKKALLTESTIKQFMKLSGQKSSLVENYFSNYEGLNEEEEETEELEDEEGEEDSQVPTSEVPDLGNEEVPEMGGSEGLGAETSVEIDDVAAKAIIDLARELESAMGGAGLESSEMGMSDDFGMGGDMEFGDEEEDLEELDEDKMANKGHGGAKSHALKEEETVEKFAENLAEQIMKSVQLKTKKKKMTENLLKKIDKKKLIENVVKRIVESQK